MIRWEERNNNTFVVFDVGATTLPIGLVSGRDVEDALENAHRKWPGPDFNPLIEEWDKVTEEIRSIALAVNPRVPQAH